MGTRQHRTIVTVTPVDEECSDIRSTVWLDRLPGDDSPHQPPSLERRQRMANNQYLADLNIWRHQRYTDPPALATAEGKGFRSLRRWATQFYQTPDPPTPPSCASRLLEIRCKARDQPIGAKDVLVFV